MRDARRDRVIGRGSWAQLEDGRIVGRNTYCGVFLCDGCLREWSAVAAFLPDRVMLGNPEVSRIFSVRARSSRSASAWVRKVSLPLIAYFLM